MPPWRSPLRPASGQSSVSADRLQPRECTQRTTSDGLPDAACLAPGTGAHAKMSGVEHIGQRALYDFAQLSARRAESKYPRDTLDQLVLFGTEVFVHDPTDRYLDLFRRQGLGLAQGIGLDLASIPHEYGLA